MRVMRGAGLTLDADPNSRQPLFRCACGDLFRVWTGHADHEKSVGGGDADAHASCEGGADGARDHDRLLRADRGELSYVQCVLCDGRS